MGARATARRMPMLHNSSHGLGMALRRWRARRRATRPPRGSGAMWVAVGAAFVAVTALGVAGFTRYQGAGGGAPDPLATRLYRSVQLFVLESGAVEGRVPWQLEIARFAAPLVAAYALVQALAAVFREQVEVLHLRLVRDHVVVAGLGRKGTRLVRALLRRGDRVVAIEAGGDDGEVGAVRALGALVVTGDARDAVTLRRAGVARAAHLVALCGDDGTNAEVVAQARRVPRRRASGTLQCVADLVEADLCLLLASHELGRYGESPVRTDFVNVSAAAAGALVRAHPPGEGSDGVVPAVAVVGAGRTAEQLLVALARAWAAGGSGQQGRPRLDVSVVGASPAALAALGAAHPELGRFAAVRAASDLRAAVAGPTPGTVYVCPDDDAAATACALDVRALLAGRRATVVAVLRESGGLGRLLAGAPGPAGGPVVATFGLDQACEPEVLLDGTTEVVARALHDAYRAARTGSVAPDDAAVRPWAELPAGLRESNRDQAAHVAVKLAAVGRRVVPLADWDTAVMPFPDPEVEVMARLEHERWVSERRRAGWRPGPRDPARRTTPYLVPWEALPEEVRDEDRIFVRALPCVLAAVGLQAAAAGRAAAVPQPERT